MAFAERCGKVWRAHWLLADGHHRGSRSGFATKWEAKHFADACEVAERAAPSPVEEVRAVEEQPVTVEAWWERWFPVQDQAPATLEAYAQQYRHHIAPRFADVPAEEQCGVVLRARASPSGGHEFRLNGTAGREGRATARWGL